MKFKIIISSYYFVFCLAQKVRQDITEDNGFNYTGKNNGNALVKFTNPEYAFDVVFRQKWKSIQKTKF